MNVQDNRCKYKYNIMGIIKVFTVKHKDNTFRHFLKNSCNYSFVYQPVFNKNGYYTGVEASIKTDKCLFR